MISVTLVPIIPENDNYAFILEADNGEVAVVDPGDVIPIIEVLETRDLSPDVILITHHHWDHTDGIGDMLEQYPNARVAGPSKEMAKIGPLHILLDEFSSFKFGGEDVQILETPGHTTGHICFYFADSGFLLAGDTVFALGCGRLLEGTAEQMFDSFQKIKALPDDTLIYCGHEYTSVNAKFCLSVDPDNAALNERFKEIKSLRAKKEPTIPTTLKLEKDTSAFMRADTPDAFAEIRKKRDAF